MKKLLVALFFLILAVSCAFAEPIEMYGKTFDSQDAAIDFGSKKIENFELLQDALSRMPNLVQVNMYQTRMEKDTMALLTQTYPHISFGWTLRAAKYRIRTDATAFSTLRHPSDKPRYGSEIYEVLRYCGNMQALDLGHNKITDISFVRGMPHLRYLILADNDIVDLTPLESLQELEYLELFMNDIEDLTPLTKLPNLIDLNLCQMELKDITPLYEMKQLKRLWISRRKPDFTDEEIQKLREALPDCEINVTAASCTGEGWRTHPRYFAVRNSFRKDQVFMAWTQEERAYSGVYPYKDAPQR